MTETKEVRGRGSWRRAVVPIAATAATVIGGMALATPANAATAPTVTVTAPGAVANNGINSVPLKITVDNSASGGAAIANGNLVIDMTVPAQLSGVECARISLTPTAGAQALHLITTPGVPANHCQWQVYAPGTAGAANPAAGAQLATVFAQSTTKTDYTYNLAVNGKFPTATVTGTLSTVARVDQLAIVGNGTLGTDYYQSATFVSTLATSAAAATNLVDPIFPTLTLAKVTPGPTSIPNNNQAGETFKLTFGETPAQGGATETDKIVYTLTVPSGLVGGDITLNDGGADFNPTCTTTACVATSPTTEALAPGTTEAARTLSVKVNKTTVTGSITITAALLNNTAPNETRATSGSVSTSLVSPSAPAFAAAPPAATVFQPYSYQMVSDRGFGGTATYTVYGYHKNAAGGFCTTSATSSTVINIGQPATTACAAAAGATVAGPPATSSLTLITDSTSAQFGKIVGSASAFKQAIANPYYTWVIKANNGIGTSVPTSPFPTGATFTPAYTPAAGDVNSAAFQIPVLFSDTPVTSTFGAQIYGLAAMPFDTSAGSPGIIGGFADGTFRGAVSVDRQAFVHFLAGLLNNQNGTTTSTYSTGPCTVGSPSAFKDVLNSNQFCAEIRDLANVGIIHGWDDGTFRPNNLIDRQAMAAFIYRADAVHRGVPGSSISDAACVGTTRAFIDVNTTNQFCGDIEWMASKGITTGWTTPAGKEFRPGAATERQATAAFLHRLYMLWNPAS